MLDIDVQGAVQVMRKLPAAVSIFVLPPSPQVLERRLRNRSEAEYVAGGKAVSETVIERRLAEARKELNRMAEYRYALVNDVLDDAVAEMRAIVLTERGAHYGGTDLLPELAASCRTDAGSDRLKAALASFGISSIVAALR